jgi:nucleoside-diphosphate-sugar epimerase
MKKILFVSEKYGDLEENLLYCLKENYEVIHSENISFENLKTKVHIVILNHLYNRLSRKNVEKLMNADLEKVIIFENAKDIYVGNSKLPFSVYNRLILKSKKSKELIECENLIKIKKNYVIFRVSELYGPYVNYGLIHDLFTKDKVTLSNDEHDFLYEGDFIHAVENALKFDAIGIFDIVNGETIKLKRLVDLVNQYRKNKEIVVKWEKTREKISYLKESFKFYKWEPIVTIHCGLKAMNYKHFSKGANHGSSKI